MTKHFCDKCGKEFLALTMWDIHCDARYTETYFHYEVCPECMLKLKKLLEIKKESEEFPQAKDIEPTVENFSKVLDNKLIGDAIQDCRTAIRVKSCNTCKNNDDEFSGECYECLKGIFDHYEPQESEE